MAASTPEASPPKPTSRRGLTPFLAALAVAAVSAAVYAPALPSLTGPAHANKPYASFDEFYPFYQREHSRTETRAMHVAGTAVVLFLMLRAPALAAAAGVAGSVGFVLSGLLRGMPNGIVEGVTLLTVFLLVAKRGGALASALAALLVGYGCAWIGHFRFEHNTPATFIYPSYSLASDFKMFFAICTGAEKL
jgi:hypothetical protein